MGTVTLAASPCSTAAWMAGWGGEHPCGAGEVDGHGVDVDAGDGLPELTEDIVGAHAGVLCGGYEVGYSFGYEGAGAACGVEDALVEGVGYGLSHDGPCQPVRGVVLAKLAALIGWDDGLVEDGGDVVGGHFPVEPGDAAGECTEQGLAADLCGPGEEVGLDDALKAGLAAEVAAME